VLVRADVYEKMQALLNDEDVRLMGPLLAELAPEDWEDLTQVFTDRGREAAPGRPQGWESVMGREQRAEHQGPGAASALPEGPPAAISPDRPAATGKLRRARLAAAWPRYETTAPVVLAGGALTAVACSWFALAPLWAGFLAGSGLVALLVSLAYAANP
jgi:hypothetical protein